MKNSLTEFSGVLAYNPEYHAERARILSVLAECLARLPGRLEVACELPPAASAALRETLDRERAALAIDQ